MISPEIFQIVECTDYQENVAGIKTSAGSDVENFYNSVEKVNPRHASNDETENLARSSGSDEAFESDSRGSFGGVSNSSARKRGIITPPSLDALGQSNKPAENPAEICECGHAHTEARRNSTGSSNLFHDQKDYFITSQRLESSHRHCSEPAKSFQGKYSLVAEDLYSKEAITCLRFRMRRNALCDPFRLPMPQRTRERIERENEKRKTSVARKVSMFLTVALDLNREEDLI